MSSEKLSTLDQVRNDFNHFQAYYQHLLADIPYYHSDSPVMYTMDFNLLHPYIFRDKNSRYPISDIVGRNIFTLLNKYRSSTGFTPVLSAPSLLELFDVITHRIDRLNKLSESTEKTTKFWRDLRKEFTSSEEIKKESIGNIGNQIRRISILDGNVHFEKFLNMLNGKTITMLVDHIDLEVFSSKEFHYMFDKIYNKMTPVRSVHDDRNIDDKLFHYKVDSWNLAAAAISHSRNDFEIDHVCRPGISQFLPYKLQTRRTRHPYVVLLRLYTLFMASSKGDILKESEAFARLAVSKEIPWAIDVINNISSISELPELDRDEIDRIFNKYIRYLTMDFADENENNNWKEIRQNIENSDIERYLSITTEEGLRHRFEADAKSLKTSAQKIVEIRPQLFDERLLGDYDLRNNPRVKEIKRKLDL